jgi:hypothetical protein
MPDARLELAQVHLRAGPVAVIDRRLSYRFDFFFGAAFFLRAVAVEACFLAPFLSLKIDSQPAEYFLVEPVCITVTVNNPLLKLHVLMSKHFDVAHN